MYQPQFQRFIGTKVHLTHNRSATSNNHATMHSKQNNHSGYQFLIELSHKTHMNAAIPYATSSVASSTTQFNDTIAQILSPL